MLIQTYTSFLVPVSKPENIILIISSLITVCTGPVLIIPKIYLVVSEQSCRRSMFIRIIRELPSSLAWLP